MQTIRNLAQAVVTATLVIGASGCAKPVRVDTPETVQRAPCMEGHNGAGIIDIDTSTTPPTVTPEYCYVKEGRMIIWRTRNPHPSTFLVNFPGGTPDADDTNPINGNIPSGGRFLGIIHRTKPHASGGNNRYEYLVTVNGVEIDPSIIIEPN
jgi:hypothetical protein